MKPLRGAQHHPSPILSKLDAIAIMLGIVVGIGIFKTPSMVAGASGSEGAFLLLWLAGGVISLIGALCYAELSATYPSVGGEYHFLRRAFGRTIGFLFAWGRMTVIQTGAIAAVAFVFGDYMSQIAPIGRHGSAAYAAGAVALLTGVNVLGTWKSKSVQNLLTGITLLALAAVVAAAFVAGSGHLPPVAPDADGRPASATVAGLAMIFVLLTYGGWNEAAYLSAELRDARRNMTRVLLTGIGLITALYLLLNFAYLTVLGLDGIRDSHAVAADHMRVTFGSDGVVVLSLMVAVASLSTLNATIFTGARTAFAAGRDVPVLGYLGRWNGRLRSPVNALLVQGAVALALVLLGAMARDGFTGMVEFAAPAFWFFFLMSGLSLFVLRWREPERARPFSVPLYPLTPAIFCATSAYMLYSSIAYTGFGALIGVAVLAAGIPLLWFGRSSQVQPAE